MPNTFPYNNGQRVQHTQATTLEGVICGSRNGDDGATEYLVQWDVNPGLSAIPATELVAITNDHRYMHGTPALFVLEAEQHVIVEGRLVQHSQHLDGDNKPTIASRLFVPAHERTSGLAATEYERSCVDGNWYNVNDCNTAWIYTTPEMHYRHTNRVDPKA